MHSPQVSRAALAAGVPTRYHYWSGRSGRRYVFTLTESQDLDDFGDGVAIAVASGRIVWSGEISEFGRELASGAAQMCRSVLVHLLATTPQERRRIIEDLRPTGAQLCVAA